MANKDYTRININIPDKLLADVDAYAKDMGVNRTSAICFMVSSVLDQRKSIDAMQKIDKIMAALDKEN